MSITRPRARTDGLGLSGGEDGGLRSDGDDDGLRSGGLDGCWDVSGDGFLSVPNRDICFILAS